MEIQPIVIGTAGHIDHGKSTLVRTLTGIDPDRLKEEKARGLTIDLGFAPLEMPDGRTVGIVDVPGHERFIKNMVAGASGIDLVVLVVAADDGVMPQTREHLSIMGILGVKRGLIALTKVDIVDDELVELAEEDVRESVAGTFLEDAPLFRISAVSGQGMDTFKEALFAAAAAVEPRSHEGVFRLPIQRVFSSKGFGTVITGIPTAGTVKLGDTLEILPGGLRGKVRGLQAYKQKTETACAGHSTAINISDVAHKEVRRGCVAAVPGYFRAARLLGARLTLLADLDHSLKNRSAIRLHTGTMEAIGEVILLDAPELKPGETGLVQLRLEEAVVCAPGDSFVLRLASPLFTLGGGKILEESRYRLKRFKSFVLDELGRQEQSLDTPKDLLEVVLARSGEDMRAPQELALEVKQPVEDVRQTLTELASRGAALIDEKTQRWIHIESLERALSKVRAALEAWFEKNPLREVQDVRDLRTDLDYNSGFLNFLLEEERTRGGIEIQAGGKIRLAGREVAMDEETRALVEKLETRLGGAGFQPPAEEELGAALGLGAKKLTPLLGMLVDAGRLVPLQNGLYLTAELAEQARVAVRENCERNGPLVIPELRDVLGTSRKYLIPILERMDAEGLTLRQGGHRILKKR
ncbi:MAG: selenocysteine-specific elongation factor [Candidatus Paceibacteria bacterium]|jgi:selenocysteine-specific elongation factor